MKAVDLVHARRRVCDEEIVTAVESLRAAYNAMCERLQACVEHHHLGLGGEHLVDLVCDEIDRISRDAP